MLIPFLFLLSATPLKTYTMDTLVVVGTRTPTKLSESSRAITVIKDFTTSSLSDALKTALSVNASDRGMSGVQTDLSIRGSTFNQALVLVNGIRVNDPQTSHHNLEIPFMVSDIDRIEILGGSASSIYGPDAFGGVVNIVTRPAGKKFHVSAQISGGTHNTQLRSTNFERENLGVSCENSSSDGYRENTDFKNKTLGAQYSTKLTHTFINYMEKEFGAADFYGQHYAREHTNTLFSGIKLENSRLKTNIYSRIHKDKYTQDTTNSDSPINRHTAYTTGVETQLSTKSFILGTEIISDYLTSNILDDHNVGKFALFGQLKTEVGYGKSKSTGDPAMAGREHKMFFIAGIRADYNSLYGWQTNPRFEFSKGFRSPIKIRASVGHAFRTPSFTELYYNVGNLRGNPNLKPENAWNYEAGIDYTVKNFALMNSVFIRDGSNIIDWVGESDGLLHARNITSDRVKGIETGLTSKILRLNYTYLWAQNMQTAKYIRNRAKQLVSGELKYTLPYGIEASMDGLYKELQDTVKVQGTTYYYVFNGKLSKEFQVTTSIKGKLFIQGMNLLDEVYKDLSLPMPGRGYQVGLKLEM
ncbi:MAG: TonB-dependent receptor [bacterium]|nr:TonB-dependent receptor [bacterium]